jgi:excisionase family DNA binding protein
MECDVSNHRKRVTQAVDKLLWRPIQVAESLELSRSKTYSLIASGDIPSIRIGSAVRVPVTALKAWIEGRTKDPDRVTSTGGHAVLS